MDKWNKLEIALLVLMAVIAVWLAVDVWWKVVGILQYYQTCQ